jgi:hypothetical protein
MAVEEHRRIALHRAAAESWGEENADTLVDLVTPAGHEMATKPTSRLGGPDAASVGRRRWTSASRRRMDQRWDR